MTTPITPTLPHGREQWFVDGYELTDGHFRDVSVRDGMYDSTPMSSNASEMYVVGRHGVLPGARRTYDAGSFALQIWILESRFDDAWDDYQQVLRAAGPQARLAHWVQIKSNGLSLECWGRLASATQIVGLGQLGMAFSLEVMIPGAFWRDVNSTVDAVSGAAPLTLPLASKATSSAPMTDLQFTVHGPITNPSVAVTSDPVISDSFMFAGTVPAGASLTFDSGTWQLTASGMAVPTLDKVTWTGDVLLEVPAAPPGATPTVKLTGSGTTAATGLTVTGHAKYQSA